MRHLSNHRSLLAKALLLALLFAAIPTAYAAVSGTVAAPETAAFTKSSLTGKVVLFSKEDFLERASAESTLEGILLTSLPSSDEGTLLLGSRTLLAGEAVTTDTLDDLCFVASGDEELDTSFMFMPVFSNGNGPVTTVSIHLSNRENRPPTALPAEYETVKNIALKGLFHGEDADGDALTYRIVKAPKKGAVEVLSDEPGAFLYTPAKNKSGADSFTYVAVDAAGLESEEVKIEVSIRKKAATVSYADMNGHPSHLSAITLAENGVFVGECIGDNYFFSPDKPVTRGEFVAMILKTVNAEVSTPVTKTGFADDADIPVWVKPYLSAALKSGIVTGVSTADGRKVFRSELPLTRAEAAIILNNAMELKSETTVLSAFVDDSYPAWAAEAVRNVSANGLLNTSPSDILNEVTRAEAADMLYEAAKLENAKPSGLLSWAFG